MDAAVGRRSLRSPVLPYEWELLIARQQLLELRVELAGVDVAVDHAAVLADENHRGQREDAKIDGQWAIEPAWFIKLRPGEFFLADVGRSFLRVAVEVDADGEETLAVLGLQ